MDKYELEKPVWSESDFKKMGWHDVSIWSTAVNSEDFEFLLDQDYIFKWVVPKNNENFFKFWVAPVTMVFENAHDVIIDIKSPQGKIEITELYMDEPWLTPDGNLAQNTYRFECQEGIISVVATGYKMYVREKPILIETQSLSLNDRKGINFARELKDD